MKRLLLFCLLLVVVPASSAVVNSVIITEQSGSNQSNYPVQIGRPFAQGEISSFPQVLIDGTPVTTQADVKQRWPDNRIIVSKWMSEEWTAVL